MTTRSACRPILALALSLALAVPAFAPVAAFAATDDDIPGVAIPIAPIVDTLDAATDLDDVYAVELQAGESFSATVTGDAGTDFDLLLFGPDAASVYGPTPPVAETSASTYPEALSYTASTSGVYYFDVQAVPFSPAGAYTATWATATADPPAPNDDDISADSPVLPASPVMGTLDDLTDDDDVFKVHLTAGQQLTVSLVWSDPDPDSAFEAFLFAPDATTIAADPVERSDPDARPATFEYVALETGDYYLDLYARFGSGAYSLTYSIAQAPPLDGDNDISMATTMSASPLSGSLQPVRDDHDLYKIDMVEGQTLDVAITGLGSPAPEFFADLYAPGTGSISETGPVVMGDSGSFSYVAEETGIYFLDVLTVDSSGSYEVSWSLSRLSPSIAVTLPSRVGWGKSASLVATISSPTGPIAGASAVVESRPYGATSFTKLADVTADGSGRVVYPVSPAKRTEYRVVFAETDLYVGQTSATKTCIPYAYLTTPSASKKSYAAGEYFTSGGYLKPRHTAGARSVRVYAQRNERQSNGSYKWVTRRIYSATNRNYGSYTKYGCGVRLPYKGSWRIRAYIIGDTTHASTWSAVRYMTVK